MALTDLILNKGDVVVTITETTLGVYGVDSNINFGEIQLVSQVSNRNIGEVVRFNKDKAQPFEMTGETGVFYLANEKEIGFSEPIIP